MVEQVNGGEVCPGLPFGAGVYAVRVAVVVHRPDGEEADQCVGRYHGGGVVKQYGVPRDEGGGDKGGNQEHVEAAAAAGGAAAVHQALPLDAHGKQAAEQDGFPGGQACPVAFHVAFAQRVAVVLQVGVADGVGATQHGDAQQVQHDAYARTVQTDAVVVAVVRLPQGAGEEEKRHDECGKVLPVCRKQPGCGQERQGEQNVEGNLAAV